MNCPRCQHANEAGAKFCEECGAPLARTCANCGRPLSPTAKFCPECAHPAGRSAAPPSAQPFGAPDTYTPKHLAEKILTSKSALEGERKQVTVLFADLKGSMELLADRDPEEARKLLDPVLERMMEAVHRYEGTVNQVMGDGIMALFGAPLAHEDHAVRACYAALQMQERVKKYAEEVRRSHAAVVKIRIGLNSGEVVVRAIGSDLHMDYTAVGQTTHLAARMEQLADPGAIVITPATLALAEGYVEVKSLGQVLVKGLADPLEVYELTGGGAARTRLQAAASRGLTRFVGRDAEVEHLRRVQGQAGAGHGQVVAIVGEAGVGKSRLVYEFTHSHRVRDWLVLEAAAVSYGRATSYLPVIDLLKGYFKIGDRDDHRDMHDKVLGRVLGLDRALEALVPPLLALLNVPVDDPAWQGLDPPQRRQRTRDAIKRLLLRESHVQPLLAVFEDLHWIDGETQALLDGLVDSLGSARLLLLVDYRPEYEQRWGTKTYYSQLRLDALPAESTAELLTALLGADPGLDPLKQMLQKRGNPFFLEETVRTLVETRALAGQRGAYRLIRPVGALQVPATVQTILAARIDRLPAEQKQLLQAASVIGKVVPYAILAAIAEQSEEVLQRGLAHVQEAEFLYEARLFPDLEYTFKHALTHEVTYGSLLFERRRALHARIVEAIEQLYGDRLGEHVERLGQHAERGEKWDKAVLYLHQAGVKTSDRSANRQAVEYFEQALAALDHLPETRETIERAIDLRVDLRNSFMPLGEVERMFGSLREAEALADKIDDPRRRSALSSLMAFALFARGNFEGALESARRALASARSLKDLALEVTANNYLGYPYWGLGDYRAAVTVFQRNVVGLQGDLLRERFGLAAPPSVLSRVWMVHCLSELGEFGEGIARADESIRIAEIVDQGWARAMASWGVGYLHCRKGQLDKAIAALERFVGQCRDWDLPMPFSNRCLTAGLYICPARARV
jgi:class 3 adenylate cyclase/tetratricopeptide (TPR) repeat protein